MSKAGTLSFLSQKAKGYVIDPYLIFTVNEWRLDRSVLLNRIKNSGIGPIVIVRSSAVTEDTIEGQPPGTFRSELNIPLNSTRSLSNAIESVIQSYEKIPSIKFQFEKNEVIVQRQLLRSCLSGVLTSRVLETGAPYYLIEYDDVSGNTDTVTSGKGCSKVYILRNRKITTLPWNTLIKAAKNIEKILDDKQLVIEFAVDENNEVHVFQARRMRLPKTQAFVSEKKIEEIIKNAETKIRRSKSIAFSDMADWNPAEMLGDFPKPLEISLYENLITDNVWCKARASLGYKDLGCKRLMQTIAGKPFIDVNFSAKSLIPKSLPSSISRRLINNRLEFLKKHPELHDKVEFDVFYTCGDVAVPPRTESLIASNFTQSEVTLIENSLKSLTRTVLTDYPKLISDDINKRNKLLDWYRNNHTLIKESEIGLLIQHLRTGLIICRDLGVFPFARLARLAFIGRDLIERLIAANCVSVEWADDFWQSIKTIATEVAQAFTDLKSGNTDSATFNNRFGHLRPHTYDITSPRYDQVNFQVHSISTSRTESKTSDFNYERQTLKTISKALEKAGYPSDPYSFLNFVSLSFREREQSKFDFTIVLSHCIESVARIGNLIGLTRLELSYLTIGDILEVTETDSTSVMYEKWFNKIVERKELWENAKYVQLPSVIFNRQDLLIVKNINSKPNFITTHNIKGEVIELGNSIGDTNLQLIGKIVAVDAADPGFDWLFSHKIAALVTKYGGAASHMAVRCAEFGIPAAIGCGDDLYSKIVSCEKIEMDCREGKIIFL
jgi:glutamine kinase